MPHVLPSATDPSAVTASIVRPVGRCVQRVCIGLQEINLSTRHAADGVRIAVCGWEAEGPVKCVASGRRTQVGMHVRRLCAYASPI